ncbi:MAG: hypothetical protein AAF434_13685 [Pseudomonadota bacterium]
MENHSEANTRFLPIWVWIIALAQIFLVLFFSIGTALNPSNFIPEVTDINYVTLLYITRNVTAAVGIVIALLLRSHRALLVMFAVRLLTDVSDIVTVYALNVEVIKESVPIVIVLLVIPALVAIVYLRSRVKSIS